MDRTRCWIRFLLSGLVSAAVFLVPFRVDGTWTLGLAWILDHAYAFLKPSLPAFTSLVLAGALAGSALCLCRKYTGNAFFPAKFSVVSLRAAAFFLALLVWLELGPLWLVEGDTGGLIFSIVQKLIPFFLLAGLFLPLLLNYGLMEFFGSFLRPVMKRLARVPGRAAVDCTASWMGSGSMGVVMTDLQYRQGFYTAREAATIATGFSIVSLPIAILMVTIIGLGPFFPAVYGAAVVVGLTVTAFAARLPPLASLPETYFNEVPRSVSADGGSALDRALARAAEPKTEPFYKTGLRITGDIWFGLLPLVMVLGTFALVLAEHTPVFSWIAWPLEGLLLLAGTAADEARAAAPALIVGFSDVFLPFIVGQRVESEALRAFIAIVGLVQIVFMTEVGALLLRSAIPLRFHHLVFIFCLRTAIAMPLAAAAAFFLTRAGFL